MNPITAPRPAEIVPGEAQIRDCMTQLQNGGGSAYGGSVQKYARLRLSPFPEMLEEWHNPAHPLPHSARPLPKAAAALQAELAPEQGARLTAFLRQQAEQGNTTAMLYLAYLHIFGRHLPVSLTEAARHIRTASQSGDWRAGRLWAELLNAAPQAAEYLLEADAKAQALAWQQAHPDIAAAKILSALQRYYAAPAAVKSAVRQKLEQAAAQGSPHAAQRLSALTISGDIPRHPPAAHFESPSAWLDAQLLRQGGGSGDDDILVLPDNVPLLPQGDGDDDKPAWWKAAVYGGIGLVVLLACVLMLKLILNPNDNRGPNEPNRQNTVRPSH